MKDPTSPEEWQECVDAALFYIYLDSARQYGLVETDVQVNIDRCEELLRRGREAGVQPKAIEDLCAGSSFPRERRLTMFLLETDPDLAAWIYGVLHNEPTRPGDFLRSFAEAVSRADPENYAVLRPAVMEIARKYPKYRCSSPQSAKSGNTAFPA